MSALRGLMSPAPWTTALAVTLLAAGVLAAEPPIFDGQKAWDMVDLQCRFGPRNAGSAGHLQCLQWMEAELKATGAVIRKQPFSYTLTGTRVPLPMTNLLTSFQPAPFQLSKAMPMAWYFACWIQKAIPFSPKFIFQSVAVLCKLKSKM